LGQSVRELNQEREYGIVLQTRVGVAYSSPFNVGETRPLISQGCKSSDVFFQEFSAKDGQCDPHQMMNGDHDWIKV
jgi:hypothetical protein